MLASSVHYIKSVIIVIMRQEVYRESVITVVVKSDDEIILYNQEEVKRYFGVLTHSMHAWNTSMYGPHAVIGLYMSITSGCGSQVFLWAKYWQYWALLILTVT